MFLNHYNHVRLQHWSISHSKVEYFLFVKPAFSLTSWLTSHGTFQTFSQMNAAKSMPLFSAQMLCGFKGPPTIATIIFLFILWYIHFRLRSKEKIYTSQSILYSQVQCPLQLWKPREKTRKKVTQRNTFGLASKFGSVSLFLHWMNQLTIRAAIKIRKVSITNLNITRTTRWEWYHYLCPTW